MARPEFVIDEEILKKVESFAANGLGIEQIAYSIGCRPSTFYRKKVLKKELREAIKAGKAKGIATVTNALFIKAKGGDVNAIKYYLNNRDKENWQEKPVDNSDVEALPLSVHFSVSAPVGDVTVTHGK